MTGGEVVERVGGRKHKAMCFTAYLGLGHNEYRRDIKQIRSGMTQAWRELGLQWTCDSNTEVHLGQK